MLDTDIQDDVYRTIFDNKEFNRLAFKLSAKMSIPVSDSKNILLDNTYDKVLTYMRNNKKSYQNIYDSLNKGNQDNRYFINYTIYNAYKEAIRQTLDFKDHIKINHSGKSQSIKTVQLNEELVTDLNKMDIRLDLNELIDIVYQVLSESAAEFSVTLLLYGRQETQYLFNLDNNQFNGKIRSIERTMKKNRVKYRHLILSPLEKKHKKELFHLKKLIDQLESPEYTDQKFSSLLNRMQYIPVINNLLSDHVSHIKYFIDNFGNNGIEDYEFINSVYKEYNRLNELLKEA